MASHWQIWDSAYSGWMMAPKDVHAQNLYIYGKRVFAGMTELGGEVILYFVCLFTEYDFTFMK